MKRSKINPTSLSRAYVVQGRILKDYIVLEDVLPGDRLCWGQYSRLRHVRGDNTVFGIAAGAAKAGTRVPVIIYG